MNILKNWINHKIKFNNLVYKKIDEIDQVFNALDIEELKNKKFLSLFKEVYFNNSFYREFYKNKKIRFSDIKSYKDINKLPILTKKIVKNNATNIKTKNKFYIKGYTSGTSGSPLVIYRTLDSIINENAYVWWYRINSGLNIGDKIVSIRGDLDKKTPIFFDKFSNTLHISSFVLNDDNIDLIYSKINNFKPIAITGYPSSINTLSLLMQKKEYEIEIPITFTSSESLFLFQRLNITKIFKSKIFDWYGNSERTIALYEKNNQYYEAPLYSINNYLTDKVLTTSLINTAFPLINYQVEDKIFTKNIYNSKEKSIIISKIIGRNDSYIELFDGSRIGTAALSLIFKNLDINKTQIIYFSPGKFDFHIVPGTNYSEKTKQKLIGLIIKRLGVENSFKVKEIDLNNIIYNKSGKFSFIIKNIKKC